jgi:hypothetical protein
MFMLTGSIKKHNVAILTPHFLHKINKLKRKKVQDRTRKREKLWLKPTEEKSFNA